MVARAVQGLPERLVPKNWAQFQHYRDRSPPWIKLHRDLLNDRAYMTLPLASKALAPLLWLLACESADGSFSADLQDLEWRLRMSAKDIATGLDGLVRAGFFVPAEGSASSLLADASSVHTVATTEERRGEREREGETEERERASARDKPGPVERPGDVSEQTWADWLAHRKAKRTTVTATVMARMRAEADKAGVSLDAALAYAIGAGWQGFTASYYANAMGKGGGSRNGREPIVPKSLPVGSYSKPGDDPIQSW